MPKLPNRRAPCSHRSSDDNNNDDHVELRELPSTPKTHTDSAQIELEIVNPNQENIHIQEAPPCRTAKSCYERVYLIEYMGYEDSLTTILVSIVHLPLTDQVSTIMLNYSIFLCHGIPGITVCVHLYCSVLFVNGFQLFHKLE